MESSSRNISVVVTGGAGFIGSHLCEALISQGHRVTAIDNFDPFYSRKRKEANINSLIRHPDFQMLELDITNPRQLRTQFPKETDAIVHLAAKAGVRPSISDPVDYQTTNVLGTQYLLEIAKDFEIGQFIFGSSSSVYGVNENVPWQESDTVLQPISPYASSKVSGELLGHVYAHLYPIRFLALRFFTVYGPRQRPDLAINRFFRMIDEHCAIPVYGDGSTCRDYTYVDDVVSGIIAALKYRASSYEIINIGNSQTVSLSELISAIEKVAGKKATINRLPLQPGDVPRTFADITKAERLLGYQPGTSLESGLQAFYKWSHSINK